MYSSQINNPTNETGRYCRNPQPTDNSHKNYSGNESVKVISYEGTIYNYQKNVKKEATFETLENHSCQSHYDHAFEKSLKCRHCNAVICAICYLQRSVPRKMCALNDCEITGVAKEDLTRKRITLFEVPQEEIECDVNGCIDKFLMADLEKHCVKKHSTRSRIINKNDEERLKIQNELYHEAHSEKDSPENIPHCSGNLPARSPENIRHHPIAATASATKPCSAEARGQSSIKSPHRLSTMLINQGQDNDSYDEIAEYLLQHIHMGLTCRSADFFKPLGLTHREIDEKRNTFFYSSELCDAKIFELLIEKYRDKGAKKLETDVINQLRQISHFELACEINDGLYNSQKKQPTEKISTIDIYRKYLPNIINNLDQFKDFLITSDKSAAEIAIRNAYSNSFAPHAYCFQILSGYNKINPENANLLFDSYLLYLKNPQTITPPFLLDRIASDHKRMKEIDLLPYSNKIAGRLDDFKQFIKDNNLLSEPDFIFTSAEKENRNLHDETFSILINLKRNTCYYPYPGTEYKLRGILDFFLNHVQPLPRTKSISEKQTQRIILDFSKIQKESKRMTEQEINALAPKIAGKFDEFKDFIRDNNLVAKMGLGSKTLDVIIFNCSRPKERLRDTVFNLISRFNSAEASCSHAGYELHGILTEFINAYQK